MTMRGVYVGLGSNLGTPMKQMRNAMRALDDLPHTRVVARSSLYRSEPVGFINQPDFINAVVELETDLLPRALLSALQELERRFGRTREFANAPRTLDLDLLLYGGQVRQERDLTLPHPQMHLRAFVLEPLLEIAPDCEIPGIGSAAEMALKNAGQMVEKL